MGVELWKEIRKEVVLLQNNISFKLGNDQQINFWETPRCSELLLCWTFPTLYAMAGSKNSLVNDLRVDNTWDIKFSRAFKDWKMDIVQNFLVGGSANSLSMHHRQNNLEMLSQ